MAKHIRELFIIFILIVGITFTYCFSTYIPSKAKREIAELEIEKDYLVMQIANLRQELQETQQGINYCECAR